MYAQHASPKTHMKISPPSSAQPPTNPVTQLPRNAPLKRQILTGAQFEQTNHHSHLHDLITQTNYPLLPKQKGAPTPSTPPSPRSGKFPTRPRGPDPTPLKELYGEMNPTEDTYTKALTSKWGPYILENLHGWTISCQMAPHPNEGESLQGANTNHTNPLPHTPE